MNKIREKFARPLSNALILIVDDEEINRTIVVEMLNPFYRVLTASSGEDAIAACLQFKPDMVLMDVMMHGMSGLEACRQILTHEDIAYTPIIFITGLQAQEEQNKCWEAGGIDFVNKPVRQEELTNRVRAHLTHKFQTDLLLKLTYIDKLTGVYNRHYLAQEAMKFERQSMRSGVELGVLMLDIDWFKPYNDNLGHLQGDVCLQQIADIISGCLHRPGDALFRFGGEEFLCLLPDTNIQGAKYIGETILKAIADAAIEHPTSPLRRVSVSIGLSCYPENTKQSLQETIESADAALYKAKQNGRNQLSESE
jgi:diguanylate cyclase (GGDEF)-like protein